MNLAVVIGAGVYGAFLLFALIFVARRLVWRARRKGFRPSSVAFGDAMQRLQILAQPEIRWVVEKKESEDVMEDGQGDPPDPKQ